MKMLKKIYSKEYFILIGVGFLPLLWKILEIAFLSSFANALNILGQIALLGIIFKVFEETLLNPLYKILGKISQDQTQEKAAIARSFLIWYVVATIAFTLVVFLLNTFIISISQVPDYIVLDTKKFFEIYIFACGMGVISKYLYTFSVISKNSKNMFIYLLIKSIVTTLLFILFVPKFACGLGVRGVAIAEIIVNVVSIIFLGFTFFKAKKPQFSFDKKEYAKLMVLSFFETVIRNVIYYCVILVFLNMLNNQDLYFVANEYIWSVMLVPTLAQSALIKQEIANNQNYSLRPYFFNAIILVLFMLVLLPLALVVFEHIYSLPNYLDYFFVLIKLVPCYVLFIVDSIIEAYFSATGKLHHILMQTIITNILVYFVAYVLYLCGVWVISLNAIILLFNLGVIVSSLYTIAVYLIELKKSKKLNS